MKNVFTYSVAKFTAGRFRQIQVKAIQEVPLTIYLNGHEVVTLLCMGNHPKSLAVGFLKSDGLITDLKQLSDIHIENEPERLIARVETSHDPLSSKPWSALLHRQLLLQNWPLHQSRYWGWWPNSTSAQPFTGQPADAIMPRLPHQKKYLFFVKI